MGDSAALVRLSLAVALASLAASACGDPAPRETLGTNAAALTANDKTAYDYFIDKGLTGVQAAGVVGNLDIESGMDPTAVESGGPGRGIAQWSSGARWDKTAGDNVVSYAAMRGESAESLGLQLDFIWFELTTFSDYGLAKLRAATTVTQAVVAFESGYEGCGTCDAAARVTDANSVLAAYQNDVPSADAGDSAVSCVVTTTGATGECISTAACAELGNHESTAGYCPGASDVQCCTALGVDGGASSANDAGGATTDAGASVTDGAGGAGGDSGGCAMSNERSRGGMGLGLLATLFACARRRRRD